MPSAATGILVAPLAPACAAPFAVSRFANNCPSIQAGERAAGIAADLGLTFSAPSGSRSMPSRRAALMTGTARRVRDCHVELAYEQLNGDDPEAFICRATRTVGDNQRSPLWRDGAPYRTGSERS